MKTSINFTTSYDDVDRFADRADFEGFLESYDFDGVELMVIGEDSKGLIQPEHVVGLHMSSFVTWVDLWEQNEEGVLHEFGTLEAAEAHYGGLSRDVLVERVRQDFRNARKYGAAYGVFHASDVWGEETFTQSFHHTDEQVIQATSELLNAAIDAELAESSADEPPAVPVVLLENLWLPGLTFLRPEIARDLLQSMHGKAGFMFDTGHAFHTNWDIATEEEGIAHIHQILDGLEIYPELLDAIKGIHLNQSITGEYVRQVIANPPALAADMNERSWQIFMHAFSVDKHQPFTCPDVRGLVDRIAPDYLTYEFITESRVQLEDYIATQRKSMGWQG